MSSVQITDEAVQAAVKECNHELFKLVNSRVPCPWFHIIEITPEEEYRAMLSGFLMAKGLLTLRTDCSKETNSGNF